jgi:hypothetical protein
VCRAEWLRYLYSKEEIDWYEDAQQDHLNDVLDDVGLVDQARPLQGHAHLKQLYYFSVHISGKCHWLYQKECTYIYVRTSSSVIIITIEITELI